MITKERYGKLVNWVDEETGQPESSFYPVKPLSNEEILEISNTMPYANRFEFARAIEKRHKIK